MGVRVVKDKKNESVVVVESPESKQNEGKEIQISVRQKKATAIRLHLARGLAVVVRRRQVFVHGDVPKVGRDWVVQGRQ